MSDVRRWMPQLLAVAIWATAACSGGLEPTEAVYFGVQPTDIPSFKSDLASLAQSHSLFYRDSSAEVASARSELDVPEDFEAKSLSYDPERTLSSYLESDDGSFVVLATNAGLPCGFVSVSLVYHSEQTNHSALARGIVSDISATYPVIDVRELGPQTAWTSRCEPRTEVANSQSG